MRLSHIIRCSKTVSVPPESVDDFIRDYVAFVRRVHTRLSNELTVSEDGGTMAKVKVDQVRKKGKVSK
jgi:hypothetical protein